MDKYQAILESLLKEIKDQSTLSTVKSIESKYLGRQGVINNLIKDLSRLEQTKRKEEGKRINEIKTKITQIIEQQVKKTQSSEHSQFYDVTLPGTKYEKGSLHPVTYAIDEISKIFANLGFIRMSYPEVEWDFFAFEALNMPSDHPARDDFETTFIDFPNHKQYGKMVLSPHTSSGQIREMWRLGSPPVRMINIAKCYRPNWDATHTPMFYQFEGLCIDKNINITHLKGTLDFFAKAYFGEQSQTRLRPHHFQFTEPSFEVDITCNICQGKGQIGHEKCKVCKSGWLELGGTGMVHPNVLTAGKINPDVYSGWAFGFGIERVIMMKYGIDDIRNYYSGDIRFLKQF